MSRPALGLITVVLAAMTAWPQVVEHYPAIVHADLPLYPPVARAAHITGTVEIQVIIEKGAVVDAHVKSLIIDGHNGSTLTEEGKNRVGQLLSIPSLANIKSWRFEDVAHTTLVVRYAYRIEGQETDQPENSHVDIDFPLIKITARPFKPTVLY